MDGRHSEPAVVGGRRFLGDGRRFVRDEPHFGREAVGERPGEGVVVLGAKIRVPLREDVLAKHRAVESLVVAAVVEAVATTRRLVGVAKLVVAIASRPLNACGAP